MVEFKMFNREQLQGVLLTVARPEVTIYRSSQSKTGWTIRTRVMFRAKREFLIVLQRKFEQLEIESILREKEGVNREAPVLIIGTKKSLTNLRELMPRTLPCSHANWNKFDTVLVALNEKTHLEKEGMSLLLEMIENEREK
tara:strand:+ start:15380 stop:15802 length:423 start_codon:yes stop_codon:yes gene_type:complete